MLAVDLSLSQSVPPLTCARSLVMLLPTYVVNTLESSHSSLWEIPDLKPLSEDKGSSACHAQRFASVDTVKKFVHRPGRRLCRKPQCSRMSHRCTLRIWGGRHVLAQSSTDAALSSCCCAGLQSALTPVRSATWSGRLASLSVLRITGWESLGQNRGGEHTGRGCHVKARVAQRPPPIQEEGVDFCVLVMVRLCRLVPGVTSEYFVCVRSLQSSQRTCVVSR